MKLWLFPVAWLVVMGFFWQAGLDAPLPVLAAALAAVGMWFVVVAPWGLLGFAVRNALIGAFSVESFFLIAASIRYPQAQPSGSLGITALLLVFAVLDVRVLQAAFGREREAIDLRFPLAGARYAIVQGGGDALVNHHVRAASQRDALDIVALGRFGLRARGLAPVRNEQYYAFDVPVYAPCDGTVVDARDELDDAGNLALRGRDVFGNYVALRRDDGVDVVLAHLRRGSIAAHAGERVAAGALLGRVGNSGRSSEPHLHLHAERGGAAVPMRFRGRLLARNAVVDTR